MDDFFRLLVEKIKVKELQSGKRRLEERNFNSCILCI